MCQANLFVVPRPIKAQTGFEPASHYMQVDVHQAVLDSAVDYPYTSVDPIRCHIGDVQINVYKRPCISNGWHTYWCTVYTCAVGDTHRTPPQHHGK